MILTPRIDTYKVPAEFVQNGEIYEITKGLIKQFPDQIWQQLAILNPKEWEQHKSYPIIRTNWPDSVCMFDNNEIKFYPSPDNVYIVKLHLSLVL